MTLTKAGIALKVSDNCGFMRAESSEIIEKLLEIIKLKLIAGDDVMISGFGKWSVKEKSARRGRNPQTGESIILEARKVVTWHYSPSLKESCNSSTGKWFVDRPVKLEDLRNKNLDNTKGRRTSDLPTSLPWCSHHLSVKNGNQVDGS